MSQKRNVSTCSLTEARIAEVVSVSEPSPLEVVRPGLRELVFSEADEGWSGTGIAPAMQEDTFNATGCCHGKQTITIRQYRAVRLGKMKITNYRKRT